MVSSAAVRQGAGRSGLDHGLITSSTQPRADVGALSFDNFNRFYGGRTDNKWQIKILEPLLRFSRLPDRWDGYSGRPLRMDTGFFALQVLEAVMRPRTPLPQVVPTAMGGVQFEWHERDIDLELHISAPYECEIWFEDHQRVLPPISEILSNDLSLARTAVGALTTR
jgi:hypothetical protein